MYLRMKIAGNDVFLTHEQASTVLDIMRNASLLDNQWVGGNAGDEGTNYKELLRPAASVSKWPTCELVPDDFVEAMRLKTKLHDESLK